MCDTSGSVLFDFRMHIILKMNCLCFIQLLKSHYVLQCSRLIHWYWLSMAAAHSRSHLTDQCTAAMATVSFPSILQVNVGVQTRRIWFADVIYWLLDLLFCFLLFWSFWVILFTFKISIFCLGDIVEVSWNWQIISPWKQSWGTKKERFQVSFLKIPFAE